MNEDASQPSDRMLLQIQHRLAALEAQLAALLPRLDEVLKALAGPRDWADAPDRGRRARSRYPLTRHEQQIISLLGQGASLKQMSEGLHVSRSSVERHIEALCRKCGAANRSQLIIWGTLYGYCTLEPEHNERSNNSASSFVTLDWKEE